jgi:hypothetical protein
MPKIEHTILGFPNQDSDLFSLVVELINLFAKKMTYLGSLQK